MTSEYIWQEEKYHSLSPEQIIRLQEQGCTCSDWTQVKVIADFNADNVHFVHFSGRIRLGAFNKNITFFGGITKPSGIRNASLHNCVFGNNVFISHINNYIANYIIEDDVIIDNIDLLAVEGESSFGNGIEVNAINEAGGREITIYDTLSSHMAYILAMYRHRPDVIKKLKHLISDYTSSVKSSMGIVGKGTSIRNSRVLKNLKIGPAAVIECAARLENGSINSNINDPVYIGHGVLAQDFIVSGRAVISDGAMISKCFIGQSTEISRQYSAENSVFFANCSCLQGEACSIFAGPYTVTHHKSTLLIAGLFSFFNAGSGTNQSNHMYRLGPVHQGIVERGSKTGSGSYMLWPAKVGAFTIVSGRHYKNFDTSDLPFSYLIERQGESILVPAANLKNAGTIRDSKKWPNRDKRSNNNKLDLINLELLNPYTVQKMLCGMEALKKLKEASPDTAEYYTFDKIKIEKTSAEKGIMLYEAAIYEFLGECIIERIKGKQIRTINELREILKPEKAIGTGKWIDLAGLIAPEREIETLLNDIENGIMNSLEKIRESFHEIYGNYPVYKWVWVVDIWQKLSGKSIKEILSEDVIELLNRFREAVIYLNNQIYLDAGKEFSSSSQIGYGIDGNDQAKCADFELVRGTLEKDIFVSEIKKHTEIQIQLADDLINLIKG
jgi:hypothetical protein